MKHSFRKRAFALLLSLTLALSLLPAVSAAPADEVTTRPLKVLCIGHSFAVDVMNHLWSVCHAEGLDLVTGLAYYSGCTLSQHVNFANNNSTVYRYYKNDNSATQTITYNVTLQHCIEDEDWDIIVLQHGTSASGNPDTYQPALNNLINYVDAHKTNPDALYMWHMTWSFQAGFPTAAFTAEDQMELYENIAAAVQQIILPDDRFVGIIPSGTAFQNARSSYFGDTLNRDGQHANDLGKLIADYTWYCALTGRTLTGLNYATVNGQTLPVGDQKVVMESVNHAMAAPFALTQSSYVPGYVTHYTWNTVKTTGSDNLTALPTNVIYETDALRTSALKLNRANVYLADGPKSFLTYAMYNSLGTSTDSSTGTVYHYGLPYRIISRAHDFLAIAENLWYDLAAMPELDTTGLGAVNLSMDYLSPGSGTTSVAFSKAMEVYVSLDGENWLPDPVGVRSVKLLGGGRLGSGNSVTSSSPQTLIYQIETENLLDIPGVNEGDVIRRIRIRPNGTYCRTFGSHVISTIAVNTYSSVEAFDVTTPRDEPEMIDLGEDLMRSIPVAEGVRTANIAWTTPQDIVTTFPAGSSAWASSTATRTYTAGTNYRGPVYERDIDSTRELFASSIVNGVYGYNGAGFAPNDSGNNTAYGMDCQTFAFNAVSRVSRTYAWSVMNTFGDPYTRLLGDLNTAPMPFYTDADVTELNTPQQMYESYALAKAGDLCIHYMTNESNSVHTRVVKSVSVVRNSDGTINPTSSKMYCTEQSSTTASFSGYYYYAASRDNSSFTFKALLDSAYIVFTLTDYAAGKVEAANVQAVAAPMVKDSDFTSGVHLAASSNYRIIKYTVTLRDVTNSTDLFTDTVWCKSHNVFGINYESSEMNAQLADLPDGEYRLDLAVDSGPLTSTTQTDVPTVVKSFPFVRGEVKPCMGNHSGRTALTQAYFNGRTPVSPAADGKYYTLPAGSYYLAEDIVLPYSIRINGSEVTTICLNGHTLRGSRTATSSTEKFYNNAFIAVVGTLTICDHTGEGALQVNTNDEITSTTYAPYVVHVSGLFNLHSGSISNSRTRYGAVLANGSGISAGVFNMYGGSISGNRNVTGNKVAGAVELQGCGTFNLYDGTISGNGGADIRGGGVDVNGTIGTDPAPVFNMYGGAIQGNTGGTGGGVHVLKNGTFNLSGGTIADNTSVGSGAGVYVAGGALFRMSGGVISGNESMTPGAGVYVAGTSTDAGTFEMTDGSITANRAADTTDANSRGGGVAVGANGNYDFSGGSVTGNSARIGGGIYMTGAGAAMEVTYSANVSGNTASVTGGGVAAVSAAAITMAGGSISGNTCGDGAEVLIAGNDSSLAQTGGTIGVKGSANTVTFRTVSSALYGEFTGGTTYLPLVTDGAAGEFHVAVRGGDLAGISANHAGISVYGGRFADSANLLACGVGSRLGVVETGDDYFRYTLAQGVTPAGDINEDGKLNGKDAVMLQRFVAGGYGLELSTMLADLNGDGKINGKDVVMLQRFVAGGYDVVFP